MLTAQVVNSGDTPSFTITAASEYHISDLKVNGTSVLNSLVNNVYTFPPVYHNYNITATFALNSYCITPIASIGGTISPNTTQTVSSGDTPSFIMIPDTEYHLSDVRVNGTSIINSMTGNVFTFPAVHANYNLSASFTLNTYTITPNAGLGGNINPNTAQIITSGESLNFSITPDNQYRILDVKVNGTSIRSSMNGNVYAFSQVTANFNITATFEPIPTTQSGTSTSSTSSSTTKTNPTPQPTITPSPTPIPTNYTIPPADDGENPVTSTPPNTSKNAVIGFFEEWSAVIGSGSLIGVAGIGLTMYGMRLNQRQRKAEKKAAEEKQEGIKRRRVTYIDQLKEFKGTKLTTDQIKKIQGIKENILVDHDLEKDEVQRLLDLVNHLLGK